MMVELSIIQEIKFLFVLGMVILGWQVSIIFFYKYYKLKDENVNLNRVLLSYGFIVLMGFFCLILISSATIFVQSPEASELLRKSAYISALSALILFWYYVSDDSFSNLVDLRITKIFMVGTFIPIILVIFLNSTSAEFRYSLGFILIEGIFLVVFQFKLVKKSVGTVKKRFILITIAGVLMLIAMCLGANTAITAFNVPLELHNLMFFAGFGFMVAGLILLFIALYNFPPILEFKWKEKLIQLIIFNQKTNSSLYYFNFPSSFNERRNLSKSETHLNEDDSIKLFSGGISGIDSVISAITNTENEKLTKIKQGDSSFILLEYGSYYEKIPLTFALVVKEDLKSIRYFLSNIKNQFESFYRDIIIEMDQIRGNVEQLFGSFKIIIENLLVKN